MPHTRSVSRATYLSLAAGVFFISFSALFTKWTGVPGPVSAFYRLLISTAALLLIQAARRAPEPQLPRRVLGGVVLAALFFAADLAFWNTSLSNTSAASATFLGNTAPVWVALGAWLLFRERPGRAFWIGLGLAVAGSVLIVGGDLSAGVGFREGGFLALLAGLAYAGYLLTTQHTRARIDNVWYLAITSALGALALLGLSVSRGLALWGFGAQTWLALLGLALITHVAGWLAINFALAHLPASLVSVTLLGQPVLTALLAVPLLGEDLLALQAVGGACVLGGILVVNRWGKTT